MTVGSIIEGAFRLLKERPGAVLIWTIILLAAGIASSFVTTWILQGQAEALFAGATPAAVEWGFRWRTFLLSLVMLMVTCIVYAAAQRAVLRADEGGPGFLRIGMDEVRFYLLALLYLVIFVVAMVVIMFIFSLFMAGAGPANAGIGVILMGAVMLVLIVYFGIKLSLTFPLTLIQQRSSIGEGWTLTDGRFWTLFGAYFILFLILLVTGIAFLFVTDRAYLSAIFEYGLNSWQAQQASMRELQLLMAGEVNMEIVLKWVLNAVQGGVGVALFGGAIATAAQELITDERGLSDTFA